MHQDDPIPTDPAQDVDLGDPSAYGLASIAKRVCWARKRQELDIETYLDASRTSREADGISDQQYRDFESGKVIPTWDQLIALSKTFDASARYLQDGSTPVNP
jgi:transcriptional regulator with XRE-family HTH domain